MKKIFLIFISSLLLTACSKSDDLSSGGTFKVTASSGITKIYSLYTGEFVNSAFTYHIDKPNSSNLESIYLRLSGGGDYGGIEFEFWSDNTIQIAKVYSFKYIDINSHEYGDNGLVFDDWIEKDCGNTRFTNGTATKTTIVFSKFQYPGRITGVIINYDKDGKTLVKGEFDFVTTKPTI